METTKAYAEIAACRVCGSQNLTNVLSLGEQSLTGVFPRTLGATLTKGPLDLVLCHSCSLLQLRQSYSLGEMYGENYGYRSGLNASMVKHLQQKIRRLERLVNLHNDDLVIDIGSNDATTLKSYTTLCRKVGIDPTANKFKEYYTEDIKVIANFFSSEIFSEHFPGKKAHIVTSISMFYDLESPVQFAKEVASILSEDGIWHFEQSYMPSMLQTNAYDTICHEHLEFYSLKVVQHILQQAGLRIVDVEINDINGGSFAVTACKLDASYATSTINVSKLLSQEAQMGLDTTVAYQHFAEQANAHRKELRGLLASLKAEGKTVLGYGASTKGNVLLQFCGLGVENIPYIAEVNKDKFGAFTPGTSIPIISEKEAHAMNPDYFLVLPWHFKNNILEREQAFLQRGGKFIFPLPHIEIVGLNS